MSEQTMRSAVVKALKAFHPVAVENTACPGTPDVACIFGWLELKQLTGWPKGIDTPTRIAHFTPQQRVWLRKHRKAGGKAWVLLQVKTEWLLIDGALAADYLGKVPRNQLIQLAVKFWPKGLVKQELIECISAD